MLEKFRIAKAKEIAMLEKLAVQGKMPKPLQGKRLCFTSALEAKAPLAVIAEYKRASPSKGDINLKVEPEAVATAYAKSGAGAISVLTEEDYFKGSLTYLARMANAGLPLLRKDFILHPLQVDQTAATPASAFLLIVRMLDDVLLRALIERGREFNLDAVVEAFDEADVKRAQAAGARIIQINNRDLDTLQVDTAVSAKLITHKRAGEFWITASGIAKHQQLVSLLGLGFDAALVGSSLMEGQDQGSGLASLIHGASHA